MNKSWRKTILYILTLTVFASLLVVAPAAQAKSAAKIITLPWENAPEKKPVPPKFVLPKQSRWGCLACHSNKNLSNFKGGREASLFVDPEVIGNSMHKKIACIDCHTNFSYDEHPAKNPSDFRKVAGLACMKCHPYQAYKYKKSIHGSLALENKLGRLDGKPTEPALCSSCHGFHDIQSSRFEPYKAKFQASAKKVCGKCHAGRYASYSDYYHGRAYKIKAKDAPTCWDCHNNHQIVKQDPGPSPVSAANLPQTCGKCHDQPTQNLTSYAPMIHNRGKAVDNNPVYKLLSFIIKREEVATTPKGQKTVDASEIVVEPKEEGFMARLADFFFPKSLRPRQEN